jgi:isopentenyl-diphosphate delta-isomerase
MVAAMSVEKVVLVDSDDRQIGTADKLDVHTKPPRLHRAVSAFVFNRRAELLVQRRAMSKYHSAGLWSNTCCGHPRPGESLEGAGERRLRDELGLQCSLSALTCCIYTTDVGSGLVEHEYDHILTGLNANDPTPNLAEVDRWAWIGATELDLKLAQEPQTFTAWFPIVLRALRQGLREAKASSLPSEIAAEWCRAPLPTSGERTSAEPQGAPARTHPG